VSLDLRIKRAVTRRVKGYTGFVEVWVTRPLQSPHTDQNYDNAHKPPKTVLQFWC